MSSKQPDTTLKSCFYITINKDSSKDIILDGLTVTVAQHFQQVTEQNLCFVNSLDMIIHYHLALQSAINLNSTRQW